MFTANSKVSRTAFGGKGTERGWQSTRADVDEWAQVQARANCTLSSTNHQPACLPTCQIGKQHVILW